MPRWQKFSVILSVVLLVFVGVGLVKAQGKELEQKIVLQLDKPENTVQVTETINAEGNLIERGSAVYRDLRIKITLKNSGEQEAKNIRLEVPLLAEIDSSYQRIIEENFSHKPVEIKKESLNRIAFIEIDSLLPGKSEVITIDYRVQVNPVG